MGPKFSLSVFILCAVLSLGNAVAPKENDGTASYHIRQKRAAIHNPAKQEPPPDPSGKRKLQPTEPISIHDFVRHVVPNDMVEVFGPNGRLGEAFVVGLFFAISHASIFNNTSIEGTRVRFLNEDNEVTEREVEHIGHPPCENIRRCKPNVAVLHIANPGVIPERQNHVNPLFVERFERDAIKWASIYLLKKYHQKFMSERRPISLDLQL